MKHRLTLGSSCRDIETLVLRMVVMISVSFSTVVAADPPLVLSVSPTPHIVNALPTDNIVVDFNVPMDTTSFSGVTVRVFGHWSGVVPGHFIFENGNTRMRFVPSRTFSSGELVTVALAKGVRDHVGVGLPKGYTWTFWVRTLPGTLDLTEIDRIPIRQPGEPRIQTYGAYGGDLNGDGHLDITVINEISHDVRVFMNDSTGNYDAFTVFPIPTGATPSPNEGADFNGDGILDIAVGNVGNDSVSVFVGDGTGSFSPVRNFHAASAVRGLAIVDFDADGNMDIVTANRNASNVSLLRGNGDGTFQPRVNIEANGTQETSIAVADANGDGVLDLFVAALQSNEMIVMLGDGDGGFTFSHKVSTGSRPWMIAVGDVNGDGNVDVVSANSQGSSASVIFGDGLGGLLAATNYTVGSFPLAIDLGDVDGDGDLDMVVSSYSARRWTVYENNGNGVFVTPRILNATGAASCATLYDRDNDGDLDHTGIDEIDDLIFVFDNRTPTAVELPPQIPSSTLLEQNYPNPFNPTTRISYNVGNRGTVQLKVFDVLGRNVATLVDRELHPGSYEVVWNASNVAGGVYFYVLLADGRVEMKKLTITK
jgi:hypothetical protein